MSCPEPFLRFWRSRFWGRWLLGGYPTEVSELPRDRGVPLELPGCNLTWTPSDHRPESIAYRLDSDRGSFVYTGDTGYTEPVVELARGADTVPTDRTFPDDRPFFGHLTPAGVARSPPRRASDGWSSPTSARRAGAWTCLAGRPRVCG